ncbi:putative BSD domain-containing protein [Dioscorea sansibarensis]
MNFFKSVFSDPDPGQNSTEDEPSGEAPAGGGGGWSFDGLIKTLSTKSESVIQTYRRDLEEFGSGLKKETAAFREAAARAVKDLPGSLEAGASVAQESLESVGQAIDDLGSSVLRGTAEIISHGKEALLTVDGDPSDSSSQANTSSKRYSRFEAQVLAIQTDPATFTEEPEDGDEFNKWKEGFKLEEKGEEIEGLLYENSQLEGFVEKLVPGVVDFGTFWTRYFYRVHKLRLAEDARASLVKRVISREEEEEFLSWEVDDDDDEKEKEIQVKDGEKKEIVEKELDHGEEKKEIVEKLEPSEENKPLQLSKDENLEVVDNAVSVNSEAKPGDDEVPPMALETSPQVSKLPSKQEEVDLEWDEIEDLGEHDDKKVSSSGGSPKQVDLRKRLSVAEDEDDLSWDIEDDDDDGPAKA